MDMFVQGIFEGDFVVVLVPIDDGDPMSVVAEKVAQHTVNRRVPEQSRPMQVSLNGKVLADGVTAADAGIVHMDVVEVAYV